MHVPCSILTILLLEESTKGIIIVVYFFVKWPEQLVKLLYSVQIASQRHVFQAEPKHLVFNTVGLKTIQDISSLLFHISKIVSSL